MAGFQSRDIRSCVDWQYREDFELLLIAKWIGLSGRVKLKDYISIGDR